MKPEQEKKVLCKKSKIVKTPILVNFRRNVIAVIVISKYLFSHQRYFIIGLKRGNYNSS